MIRADELLRKTNFGQWLPGAGAGVGVNPAAASAASVPSWFLSGVVALRVSLKNTYFRNFQFINKVI